MKKVADGETGVPAGVPEAQPVGAPAVPAEGVPSGVAQEQQPAGQDERVLQLLDIMVRAYSTEKISEYQYEWAVQNALGKNRSYFVQQCEEHRKDEGEHADLLAERIAELGGNTPFALSDIVSASPYPPVRPTQDNMLVNALNPQIVTAESQAVELYQAIIEFTDSFDPVTNDLAIRLKAKEEEHLLDMSRVQFTLES